MAHKGNNLVGILSMPQAPSGDFQERCIVPSDEEQVVTADSGHAALSVAAIPSNYGRISFNGYELKVE